MQRNVGEGSVKCRETLGICQGYAGDVTVICKRYTNANANANVNVNGGAGDMPKVCPGYPQDILTRCQICAQQMPINAKDFPKICSTYTLEMPVHAKDMPKIWPKNTQDRTKICPSYTQNMPKQLFQPLNQMCS